MAFLKIFGDWKGAREALNGVARHAKKVNAQIKSSFSGLNSFFSKVFSPLGFGLGGLGITTVFTQIVNKLDAIGKSSANMGVSAEYFQKMNFAAERTGTSIDQVREAFAKVQALVGKFMTGDKNAAGIMGQLGLTREDLAGLNAEQTFDKVNRALRGIGDEQTRNAVAAKLYGETFQKLNNFLRDYVDLGEEAQSRGLIVNDEEIKAAEDLKDAITNLGTALTVLASKTGFISWLKGVAAGIDAMDGGIERAAKRAGMFSRKDAIDYAIDQAEKSGYDPTIIARMRENAQSYADRKSGAWNPYIEKALKNVGMEDIVNGSETFDPLNLPAYKELLDSIKNKLGKTTFAEDVALRSTRTPEELEAVFDEISRSRQTAAAAAEAAALEKQNFESALLAARMNLGSLGESEQKLLDQAKTAEEVYGAEDKIREARKKRIAALEQELKYQQMIMQGKAREVEIEKQLRSEAKARGIDVSQLDAATVERIRNAAGARYDLQHPEQAAASAAASGAVALSSRIAEYPTDALRRIGGYSGAFNSSNPSLNYQRKSTDFLDKINQRVSSIEQNLQTSGTSGATFP